MKQHDDQADNKTPQEDGSNLPSPTETRQQLTNVFFRELLKTAVYPLAAAAIIVLGSIAWFVSNNRVQSGMLPISAESKTVRLATTGVRQIAETKYLTLSDGTQYNKTDYYYTEDGEIALRLSKENEVVSPGASGSITFYIIPTRDGADTITLYLDMAGYKVPKGTNTAQRINDPVLDALLSGHILLFGKKDENGHYSGWLFQENGTNSINSITVELPEETKADVPCPVTLYWVWPLRYENMKNDLYAENSSEYEKKFAPFIQSQATNLTKLDPDNESNPYSYSRIFLTNEPLSPGEMTASRTTAYNLADEYIGTKSEYLYLTIQTEPIGLSTGSDVDTGKEQS